MKLLGTTPQPIPTPSHRDTAIKPPLHVPRSRTKDILSELQTHISLVNPKDFVDLDFSINIPAQPTRQDPKNTQEARMTTTTSQDFWDAAASMIAVTEKHPFLVAMVDGTLADDNFKYYVIQDALYLKEFADCLRRLAKSANSKEDSERLDSFAKGAEEAEMSLHKSFFVEWNISDEGAEEMPNCLLYTSYMKRIVATKCHAEGLAVLLPCFWVYMHVGQCMLKLRDELGDSVKRPPQFDAWIDMYGGDEFEKEVRDYIDMVDVACKTASDSELKAMKKHFLMSCKLEHMFWDQATNMMKWPEIGEK